MAEFSANGYRQASINRLVKRLNIAKGSIFQYFGSKDGLFFHLFTVSLEHIKDDLRAFRKASTDLGCFERIEGTLRAGLRYIVANPLIYRLYLRVLFESGIPYRREILSEVRRQSIGYLRGLVETGQQRGELRRDVAPGAAAFVLDAIMDRFLQAQCEAHLDAGLGLHGLTEAEAGEWVNALMDMIRTGLSQSSGDGSRTAHPPSPCNR